MKRALLILVWTLAICAALVASVTCMAAESFFDVEAAAGGAIVRDQGDGVWVQRGAPGNSERTNVPAYLIGLTGPVWSSGRFDVRWHADYVYIGEFRAAVDGVPDEYYDPARHVVLPTWKATGLAYSPFSGHGHLQGVPLTLDFGYMIDGFRVGLEGGPWLYWQTWHESLDGMGEADQWHDLSHKTQMQVGWTAGASVTRKNFTLSYRHYSASGGGNPYPGLSSGADVLMLKYRF